jgi:hypothetical protein
MECNQNNEGNFSTFLTYFNMLLLALIMFSIIANVCTEDDLEQDLLDRNIFIPVRASSVFMWGGLNNWAYSLLA